MFFGNLWVLLGLIDGLIGFCSFLRSYLDRFVWIFMHLRNDFFLFLFFNQNQVDIKVVYGLL